jgi:hypothetical protein
MACYVDYTEYTGLKEKIEAYNGTEDSTDIRNQIINVRGKVVEDIKVKSADAKINVPKEGHPNYEKLASNLDCVKRLLDARYLIAGYEGVIRNKQQEAAAAAAAEAERARKRLKKRLRLRLRLKGLERLKKMLEKLDQYQLILKNLMIQIS